MADTKFKIEIDTSELDLAIEKAERLRATLKQVKALQAEIATAPKIDVTSLQDVERIFADLSQSLGPG